MKKNYKFNLTGIIGCPLGHSLSPLLHNYWISQKKKNSYYCPIEIKNLTGIDKSIKQLNFRGINVTIPYKKTIINSKSKVSYYRYYSYLFYFFSYRFFLRLNLTLNPKKLQE